MIITVQLLCELFRYRWNIPILAELAASEGCKYVTLSHRLTVADGPLRQSLDFLIANEWVTRNPGYGHPSRPEYILTESGREIAGQCRATLELLDALAQTRIGLNRWTVPLLVSLAGGRHRFGELCGELDGITPRALANSLRETIEAGLAERRVTSEMPVAVSYHLTTTGARMTRIWTSLQGL